jgi:hypothetical protein
MLSAISLVIEQQKNELDRIAKVQFFPHLFLCLARMISLSGHLQGSIFSREGDIASTQNLLISFKPIICKLNYSHVINNNGSLLERGWNAVLYYEKCWPNFLSEATFNKTNFWFIFLSFLRHKIIVIISNMFIYAEVGSSKFVEMIDAQMQHFLTEVKSTAQLQTNGVSRSF